MQYRKFGNLDFKVSALGFGAMRFPTTEGDPNSPNIIENEAIRILREAIDRGVNYVDTAWVYHSGASETLLGKALKDGYREKIILADKAPMMVIKTTSDFDNILDGQLKRLNQDHIDLYLIHGLSAGSWKKTLALGLMERAEAAKKAGKIGHIGFSFHDSYEAFEEIINGYDKWEFCQIQYNIMDEENQAGTKGLELAASKGLGVTIMEPLRGGKLAKPTPEVAQLMKERGYDGALADLCLRWVWNRTEVGTALSGMTTMRQLEENIISAENSLPCSMTESELQLVKDIEAIYAQKSTIPCTGCAYCMPCPQNIPIPRTLELYNEAMAFNYTEESKRMYHIFGKPAAKCVACGECEGKCPQAIKISEWMPKIDVLFT